MLLEKDRKCYEAGVEAVHHLIEIRAKNGKSRFTRLDEDKSVPFIVPAVTWDSIKQIGSLNNEHWHFDVPYAFREALDLIFIERVRNKKKVYLWTQGALISFKEGDLIRSWYGNRILQVKYANPMGWNESKGEIYYGSVAYTDSQQSSNEINHLTQLDFLSMLING